MATLTAAGAPGYPNAGHSEWVNVAAMASRLRAAGVARALGYATNVSGFQSGADEQTYAERISAVTGGARYVVDTRRNSAGCTGDWCDPAGRELGGAPRLVSEGSNQDANLGDEGHWSFLAAAMAGRWWPDYATSLTRLIAATREPRWRRRRCCPGRSAPPRRSSRRK